ncbi:hypothetical protein TEA_016771 [Camellia sinensis var. sinensis]|uniref:Uncharacterized protein n=1 Tax=Camellia sinensis var. sinensis TaxID=542762 RepID=A0A4V3WNR0_CAMSN|nr:hypothetical protein TEA_016771 [Camellia sinensis var. sinensis]
MPMEGSELGMVEAKAAREVSERARFLGKSQQTVVRRCQRIDVNDKRRYVEAKAAREVSETARTKNMREMREITTKTLTSSSLQPLPASQDEVFWLPSKTRKYTLNGKALNHQITEQLQKQEQGQRREQLFQKYLESNMVLAMYSSCCKMINKWKELVSTTVSCELDVWPDLTQLSADLISRTAFDSSYEGGKRIFQLQR